MCFMLPPSFSFKMNNQLKCEKYFSKHYIQDTGRSDTEQKIVRHWEKYRGKILKQAKLESQFENHHQKKRHLAEYSSLILCRTLFDPRYWKHCLSSCTIYRCTCQGLFNQDPCIPASPAWVVLAVFVYLYIWSFPLYYTECMTSHGWMRNVFTIPQLDHYLGWIARAYPSTCSLLWGLHTSNWSLFQYCTRALRVHGGGIHSVCRFYIYFVLDSEVYREWITKCFCPRYCLSGEGTVVLRDKNKTKHPRRLSYNMAKE